MTLKIHYLKAKTPIVKRYERGPEGLIKHPYPFVYDVTSTATNPTNIQALHQDILTHAKTGGCMVKGELQRQLQCESRAGSTDRDRPTGWICLDLDGVNAYQDVDQFLKDAGLEDTDYVLQWSSSMGLENQTGFRCHVFMLINRPMHPQLLKQWLQHLNLSIPTLRSQLELTKTGNALKWTLDVTTCQNDKLLYIAPPKLGAGIQDPFNNTTKPRISLELRSKRKATIPTTIPTQDGLRTETDKVLNELRTKSGMSKRRATKTKFQGPIEYITNPDTAIITEKKTERGFVYFNLNGGDSWAYYHPTDNPEFIRSFKGEPNYRTEDLLPDYWAEVSGQNTPYQPAQNGNIYFAFREFKTGNYYNGWLDTKTNKIALAQAKSETQLRHFMTQHAQHLGDTVPDWELKFDPQDKTLFDANSQSLNIYIPSSFYTNFDPAKPTKQKPTPTIDKVISHVLNHETATVQHFINWLSCVVQYQTHTDTAWVLQGTQGTGKGVLFHQIIAPLLGRHNTTAKRMEEIESEFTGYAENVFLVFVDEMEKGSSLYHAKVTAKLKNLITEPEISIRKMYSPPYMAPNFSNMIFASNKHDPIEIQHDDRRFNVGGRQEQRLMLTQQEIDVLIPDELEAFFARLMTYPANRQQARTPINNQARATVIDIGTSAIDSVSKELLAGNISFFWDHLRSTKNTDPLFSMTPQGRIEAAYKTTLFQIVKSVGSPSSNKLTREDIHNLLEYLVGAMPQSPHKFTALLKHHNIHLKPVWIDNKTVRGLEIAKWICPPKQLNDYVALIPTLL